MNKLRLSTGHEIPLDGDLLAVLEGLYREVTARREFRGSFEDMIRVGDRHPPVKGKLAALAACGRP